MKNKNKKKTVIFSTIHSNLKTRSDGSSVNDFKIFLALAKNFNVVPVYRDYRLNNSFFKNIIATIVRDLKIITLSLRPNQIFILRGPGMNLIPCLLKKIMKHKIYLSLGCTPVLNIEHLAFKKNIEFNQILKKLKSINYYLYFIDLPLFQSLIQNYQFRKANKFIVENEAAKKLLKLNSVDESKIVIIPYYVNHYFLHGINPPYNPKSLIPFKMAYTGRFGLYDNLIPIIEAIKVINKNSFKVKMIFIGDGLTRSYLQDLIIREEIADFFEFRGGLYHEELAKSLDEFHCLLLPMVKNIGPSTIAIKILEGIMNKKVIITTKSGYNMSLFPPKYDLILENLKANDIIELIEKVKGNYEEYRIKMINNQINQKKNRSFFKTQNCLKQIINEEPS